MYKSKYRNLHKKKQKKQQTEWLLPFATLEENLTAARHEFFTTMAMKSSAASVIYDLHWQRLTHRTASKTFHHGEKQARHGMHSPPDAHKSRKEKKFSTSQPQHLVKTQKKTIAETSGQANLQRRRCEDNSARESH